jgi:hypothetical protein
MSELLIRIGVYFPALAEISANSVRTGYGTPLMARLLGTGWKYLRGGGGMGP